MGPGTVAQDPDQVTYCDGDQVTLTATPTGNSRFDGWSGDENSGESEIVVTMDSDKDLTATFIQQYVLTVAVDPAGGGTTDPAAGIHTYDEGTPVDVTATPNAGYRFDEWSGACSGDGACQVTMDADQTVTAHFIRQYVLTVAVDPTGGGTTDPAVGTYIHDDGDIVDVTATPNAGYRFDQWSGACSGTGACQVTMDANKTVTAHFVRQYVLTVAVDPTGGGTTDPAVGTHTYDAGTPVDVTATPNAGYRFDYWSGACSGSGACQVTMNANRTVTAHFMRQYVLTVIFTGDGSGTVTAVPPGAVYDDDTQVTYDVDTEVTLTAAPAAGSQFGGWSGAASGTQNPVTVTMNGDRTVFVQFTRIPYTLTINKDGDGSGTVTKDPNQTIYYYGDVVTLTATPATGSSFDGWSGALTGNENPATLTIYGNTTVTATFTRDRYTLTVSTVGCGTVTKNPNLSYYYYNDQVTLTAQPCTGWRFAGWSGDLSGTTNPATLTMNEDKSVIAIFTEIGYTLTVNIDGCGSVTKDPNEATYTYGEVVTLTADPCDGWSFSRWSGDLVSTQNPATITINGDKVVTARFTRDQYTLTVNVVGSGSVTKSPNQSYYYYGDEVTLTAEAATGWSFDHWSGALSGDENPATLTIYGNTTVTATFTRDRYTLSVNVVGNGTVTTDPEKSYYYYGEWVTLTATPATGWRFGYWSGALTGTTNPKELFMNGNKTVTATFIRQYHLTVTLDGDGSGSVTLNPSGGTYDTGTVVQLTPEPSYNSVFENWSGPDAGDVRDNGDGT